MSYDASAFVARGRTLSDLLDYTDDDDDDYDESVPGGTYSGAGRGTTRNAFAGATTVTSTTMASCANPQAMPTSLAKFQPSQHKHANSSVLNRIHLEEFSPSSTTAVTAFSTKGGGGGGASGARAANNKVVSDMCEATLHPRASKRRGGPKEVDRSERATVENVMDPRTRLLLYKLVNNNFLREIHGCVSTGKEANVYYAVCGDGTPAAVKVYKTSILVFKDRDKYVSGEFRFQRYCKSNPRKMVRTWAEKEARNLSRLREGGVQVPAVKLLRQHILLMDFIGEDGWPAPRLKEVVFPSLAALDRCYLELCCTIRTMFIGCRLIHGDLSEYNLLVHKGHVVVIDVSQSVEHDHPLSMDFLRRDLVNINAFFRSKGHQELFRLQDLFFLVTVPVLPHLSSLQSQEQQRRGTHTAFATTTSFPSSATSAIEKDLSELTQFFKDWRAQQPKRLEESDPDDEVDENEKVGHEGDGRGKGAVQSLGEEKKEQKKKKREEKDQQDKVDEQVFLRINVPRALSEFSDIKPPNPELAVFMEQMISREKPERRAPKEDEERREEQEKMVHDKRKERPADAQMDGPATSISTKPNDEPPPPLVTYSKKGKEDASEKSTRHSTGNSRRNDPVYGPSGRDDNNVCPRPPSPLHADPADGGLLLPTALFPSLSIKEKIQKSSSEDLRHFTEANEDAVEDARETVGLTRNVHFHENGENADHSLERNVMSDGEEDEEEEEEVDAAGAENRAHRRKQNAPCLADMTKEERKEHKAKVKQEQAQRRVEKKQKKNAGKKQRKKK